MGNRETGTHSYKTQSKLKIGSRSVPTLSPACPLFSLPLIMCAVSPREVLSAVSLAIVDRRIYGLRNKKKYINYHTVQNM